MITAKYPDIAEFLANLGNDGGANARIGRSPEDKARRRRIGERVKALRTARGMTREGLAKRTTRHMRADTIAEIEEGRSVSSRGKDRNDLLRRIAAVLGTTLAELEREEGTT